MLYNLPAEGADGVFGLVSGVILVLSSRHVQEAVQHSHTLVETLGRQLGEVAPGGSSVTGVPPQHLNGRVKGQFPSNSLCQSMKPPEELMDTFICSSE